MHQTLMGKLNVSILYTFQEYDPFKLFDNGKYVEDSQNHALASNNTNFIIICSPVYSIIFYFRYCLLGEEMVASLEKSLDTLLWRILIFVK